MQKKAFVLQNKGMNRDLSVSKAGESSAYENHNIRILARDNDTMLSVTGERGNKQVVFNDAFIGNLRVTEDLELRLAQDERFRTIREAIGSGSEQIPGELIGWNVLNNHIILFVHKNINK